MNIRKKLLSLVEVVEGPLPSPCWLWAGSTNNCGYGYVTYGGGLEGVHRISWELQHGPIPNGLWICHRCDRPGCLRPSHLFIGTPADNVADMVAKGRAGWMVVIGATAEPIRLR